LVPGALKIFNSFHHLNTEEKF